jgi:hypothetical protein
MVLSKVGLVLKLKIILSLKGIFCYAKRNNLFVNFALLSIYLKEIVKSLVIYSGDPNTRHPNTGPIPIPDFFSSSFQMAMAIQKLDKFIQFSNGLAFQNWTGPCKLLA